ncbi:MAG: hypothetical protein DCC55_25540 [Chloroflexi bacterium]|nr:MAG: hypothetical protein DCC55_25540 [Chloroflexota bacterium]
MPIKTFATLAMLAEHFDGVIYRDTLDDSLLVQDEVNNVWYRYRWTQGKREIKYWETLQGSELPLMVQEWPRV